MPSFQALLCDLDGTLADSEPLHCAAWLHILNDIHQFKQYDEHWFEQYVGTSDTVVGRDIVASHDLGLTAEELIRQKRDNFHQRVRSEAKSFPGVLNWLERISAGFPLAVATNSGREDADVMIAALDLMRFARTSVTADDVEEMKPAPDIYLVAAKRLGVPAESCIAIEDSVPGGQAAKAAGCYLIGVEEKVTMADEYFPENAAALERAYQLLTEAARR